MSRSISRRIFLGQSLAAGAALASVRVSRAADANSQVGIACIGVGGKGKSDMLEVSAGHNIVAICDIDEGRLAEAAERFPKARKYTDWRKMLEQSDIDAVTISTPDHMHAPATMSAMLLDKHVYTQKPLTHTIHEARQLARVAKERQLVTQMGIQHHATARFRAPVQAIRDGIIGKVTAAHVWTDRPGSFWKQGLERPDGADAVPSGVHWDLWLGAAPERPYLNKSYHPFAWRGWWDFGTGALGDMGCHMLDPVVSALDLAAPKTIVAEGPPPHAESGPTWCVVRYLFPGTKHTVAPFPLTWYESDKRPPIELFQVPEGWAIPSNGVLFLGEKGNLFLSFLSKPLLFPEERFVDAQLPEFEDENHYQIWTKAIVDGQDATCPFSYSGPLTETVLLGNVAYRSGAPIEWDSAAMRVTNNPAANEYLRREYRRGWEVAEL